MRVPLTLDQQCELSGLPRFEREYRFAPPRRWRFDWANRKHMLAIEEEGGAFVGGRHTSGSGFLNDMEKYNAAVLLGWRVLRVTPRMVQSGEALALVEQALKATAKT